MLALLLALALLLSRQLSPPPALSELLWALALLASNASLYAAPTFEVREIGGYPVPFQNGVVYPTFGRQPSRLYVDLSGDWELLYDEEAGNARVGGVRLSLSARSPEVVELLTEQMRSALARGGWRRVRVPSVNNARGSEMEGFQGVAWYRKVFEVPAGLLSGGRRVFLVFHGANYVADVWLNGVYLGYHEGGFTPFVFDATGALREGANELVVRVDNVPWDSEDARFVTVPYKKCDWWNYGGIYRDVYLEAVNATYIARLDLVPRKLEGGWGLEARVVVVSAGGGRARLELRVHPASAAGTLEPNALSIANLSETVVELSREVELEPGVSVVALRAEGLKVREWSPESPSLYAAAARLVEGGAVLDEVWDQFGFREVKAEGSRILLNGKPVFLKGVSRHEDYPGLGRALPPSLIYEDLRIVKEMGANFLRTAHYPNHPLTYVYADRLGLLVWEEIPVYWFDCEALRAQLARGVARQMLLEMVYRDFNRPSIIIWSLANECGCRDERVALLRDLAQAARRADPTRLLTQAIAWDPSDDTTLRAGLDVLSVNMYFGVFYGKLEDMDAAIKELGRRYPSVPIVISEFGFWSGGGVGEARQAEYFARAWKIIESNRDLLSGAAWWTAFDYDSMIVFDTFGALDWQRGHRKLLFYDIKRAYESFPPAGESGREGFPSALLLAAAAAAPLLYVAGKVIKKKYGSTQRTGDGEGEGRVHEEGAGRGPAGGPQNPPRGSRRG